jgi:hypothetical protein
MKIYEKSVIGKDDQLNRPKEKTLDENSASGEYGEEHKFGLILANFRQERIRV